MDDAPGTQFNNEEHKERAKPEVVGLKKIASPHLRSVILQKAVPGLTRFSRRWSRANLAEVFGDGAFGQGIAQFPQFITNAFGSPQATVECHGVDEGNYVCRDTRLWCFSFGLVTPEQTEDLAMPTEQGIWFYDHQRLSPPAETTREQDEDRTRGLTLKHNQLLTQKGVFGDELGLAARDVCKRAKHEMRFSGLEVMFDGLPKCRDNTTECLTDGGSQG